MVLDQLVLVGCVPNFQLSRAFLTISELRERKEESQPQIHSLSCRWMFIFFSKGTIWCILWRFRVYRPWMHKFLPLGIRVFSSYCIVWWTPPLGCAVNWAAYRLFLATLVYKPNEQYLRIYRPTKQHDAIIIYTHCNAGTCKYYDFSQRILPVFCRKTSRKPITKPITNTFRLQYTVQTNATSPLSILFEGY